MIRALLLVLSIAALFQAPRAGAADTPATSLSGGAAVTVGEDRERSRFDALLEKATRERYEWNPSLATFMGVHDYDAQLENTTKAAIQAEADRVRRQMRELAAINRAKLGFDRRVDYDLFENDLKGRLYRLTELRDWEKDPSGYGYGWSIESLIARNFAPAEERLKSVISRLRQVPRQLGNGRANLKNPNKLIAEFAAEDFEGMIGYLDKDVPAAFASVKDPALWRQYDAAKTQAQLATRSYVKWIKEDLLPRSRGSYVLGEDAYRKRLHYEEMIDLPLDTLLAIGSRELSRLEARYADAASRIAPGAPLDSVIAMMRRDHPTREGLLDEVRALLGDLRDYCVTSKFIAIPSTTPLTVRPTPDYAASRSFASFDGPGPMETKARDSYYNVTMPGAGWDSARVEQHLQGYSRWSLPSVSIHECYPGHYVHSLYMTQAPSLARKTMWASSFGEGWGLYTEEALFDHGYARGDARKEFGMLRWALVRSCRLQAGIRVHTRGMTMEEATQLFMDHAHMERSNAEREAHRAAFDPLYVVYTIGAMQIRKLRDDVRDKEGSAFDLARFHARILSQGSLPVVLLRRVLLQEEGPSL